MKRCPECSVLVGGTESKCPLCGAPLTASPVPGGEDSLYPDFSQPAHHRERFPFLAKLFAFLSLITIVVCGAVNLIINGRLTWSIYVIGAIAALWCSAGVHLLTRINLNYKLLADLCALSFYLILVDRMNGWHRWSVDYVIPILYIGIMITAIVLALVFRTYWREYILSLVAICVLGIGPLLIFLNSQSPIRYLCLGAALLAAALLIGLMFFAGGKMFSEWKRRMNI